MKQTAFSRYRRLPSAYHRARAISGYQPHWKIGLSLALAFTATALLAAPDKEEKPMPLKDMPAAVQKTAQENLRGGAVVKTEKEKRGPEVIYEVIVARGAGERFALEIAPDGKLIQIIRGTASSAE